MYYTYNSWYQIRFRGTRLAEDLMDLGVPGAPGFAGVRTEGGAPPLLTGCVLGAIGLFLEPFVKRCRNASIA